MQLYAVNDSAALRTAQGFLTAILFIVIPLRSQIAVTDNILCAAEHVPANARAAGTSGSGVAIPEGVSCVLLNPSLLHSYNMQNSITSAASVAYATGEPVFSRHNVSAAAGVCVSEALSCGVLYRMLKPDRIENIDNQVVLNISGRLFDKSLDRGMVNFGVNARYEKLKCATGPFDTLYSVRSNLVVQPHTDSMLAVSTWNDGFVQRRRLAFDVGFFQDNIGEGIDFGVTLHNLIGYSWVIEEPSIVTSDSVDTIMSAPGRIDTLAVIQSSYYAESSTQYTNWQQKHNRRMTIGFAFHKEVLRDKAIIYLPIDWEIFNLFDFNTRHHFAFRTGLEVWITGKYCLRFGYARAPEAWPPEPGDLKNANIFSGGAGVRASSFGLDFYIRQSAFGIGGSFAF